MNKLGSKYQFEAIWPFIRNGAIPRSGLSATVGNQMKSYIREEVFEKLLKYPTIDEKGLYSLIDASEQKLNSINTNKKKYLFGNAQKFVNLTLKSMWLVGWLDTPPPHFPVDRIIQKYIKRPDGVPSSEYPFKWTDMSRGQYDQLILSPKRFYKNEKEYKIIPLNKFANWELDTYYNHIFQKQILL